MEKYLQTAGQAGKLSDAKNNPVPKNIPRDQQQAYNKSSGKPESPANSKGVITTTVPVSFDENKSGEPRGPAQAQRIPSVKNQNAQISLTGANTGIDASSQTGSAQIKNSADPESFHEPVEKAAPLSVYRLNENPSVYGMPFPPFAKKDITLNSETAGNIAKTNTKKAGSQKGIYAVVLGGPDWSTVKMQSTEQAGYSLGILVGYRFNNRLSIETGLLWDKKNYYSDGQYFDKSKINSIHPIDKILSVDGYCNMFEIPLNLSYYFANRNNHGFFVTTGLSSYLMKKEYYSYEASGYYGSPWTNDSTYFNSSKNLFSILQISGGYEFSIGKNTNIRIEPYVKIPLGGIGIGNMPISSMGIYFGISHLFH